MRSVTGLSRLFNFCMMLPTISAWAANHHSIIDISLLMIIDGTGFKRKGT